VHHKPRSARRDSLWKELIKERLHNVVNEIVAVEIALRYQHVDYVRPVRVLYNNEHELLRLNSRSHFRRDFLIGHALLRFALVFRHESAFIVGDQIAELFFLLNF
jgi:hypothetical protein